MLALNTSGQYLLQYFKNWGNRVKFDNNNLDGLVISQGVELESCLSLGGGGLFSRRGLVIRGGMGCHL